MADPLDYLRRISRRAGRLAAIVLLALCAVCVPAGAASPTPSNDAFASPTILTGSSGTVSATNVGATKEVGEPDHAGNAGGASVWFSWTAPSSGRFSFSTQSSQFDTLLAAYTGDQVDPLTLVASNDNLYCGTCVTTSSLIQFDATAGQTYDIAVDGKNGATGFISLAWEPTSTADDFPGDTVTGAFGRLSASTLGATRDPNDPVQYSAESHIVWFSWTAPVSEPISFAATGYSYPIIAVYTGSSLTGLTEVAQSGCCVSNATLQLTAVQGQTYRIALGASSGGGDLTLSWGNDQLTRDFSLLSLGITYSGSVNFTNVGATSDPGEPLHAGQVGGASVWFFWQAPADGTVRIDTEGSGFDTLLSVYTAVSLGYPYLQSVAENDDANGLTTSAVSLSVTAHEDLLIAVDGKAGATGSGTLNIQMGGTQLSGLTVARSGTGSGLVTSTPSGIDCGTSCSTSFDTGATTLQLTATPSADSLFTGWSGNCAGTTTTCDVTLDQARNVTAEFTKIQYPLGVSTFGTGSGSVTSTPSGIDCGTTCSTIYDTGTTVQLTAIPSADSLFTGWSGDCAGTTATCDVTLDQARSVTAEFTMIQYPLSVSVVGNGSGSVTSAPSGIDCGTSCSTIYDTGTTVQLNATPGPGSVVDRWSGDCAFIQSGPGIAGCTVNLDQAGSVTVEFNQRVITATGKLQGYAKTAPPYRVYSQSGIIGYRVVVQPTQQVRVEIVRQRLSSSGIWRTVGTNVKPTSLGGITTLSVDASGLKAGAKYRIRCRVLPPPRHRGTWSSWAYDRLRKA